jgi:polysaccharide export outer membrane protein
MPRIIPRAFLRGARLVLVAAAVLCAGAAAAQTPSAQQGAQAAGQEYYRIGPSDLLEIIVWKEVAISRSDLLVRPDGRISLPLVDDVLVAGLTPVEVKKVITRHLLKYVEVPQVYVTVKDPRSQFCCVLGNVREPGRYQMLTPTNVLQALAMAGGFNEWADKDDVVIVRGSGRKQQRLPFQYSEVVSGDKMEQNFRLLPGDVIVVP